MRKFYITPAIVSLLNFLIASCAQQKDTTTTNDSLSSSKGIKVTNMNGNLSTGYSPALGARLFDDFYTIRKVKLHYPDSMNVANYFNHKLEKINKTLYTAAMEGDIPTYESEQFQNQYGQKELETRLTSKVTVEKRPQPVERPTYTVDTTITNQASTDDFLGYHVAEKWNMMNKKRIEPKLKGIAPVLSDKEGGFIPAFWLKGEDVTSTLSEDHRNWLKQYLKMTVQKNDR